MSCIWNANGTITCNRTAGEVNGANANSCHDIHEYYANANIRLQTSTNYSINIIVTNIDKSAIYYSKAMPSIASDKAYILDKINLPNFNNRNSQALLTIQDLTNYQGPVRPPPYLQLIIQNHKGEQNSIKFESLVGMNVLLRTATIQLPATSPTLVIIDRLQMGLK
jgi:hypothetical protein